ncbi:MAG: 4-hydroxy-tetrahydrodipicolinate synthase [Synergistaceae bacterium]|nr:4-hydroxy-tetrahydrodipicolinate synthase [Synergistaceae bacterium]
MKKVLFKGSGVAVVTPFTDGGIDFETYGRLIDFQIESGTQAIISCGTTGESATLSESEHKSVISFAVERVNKRVPVIAGTGSNNTAHALEMSKFAQSAGADGLLVVTPYYNKTTQNGVVAHFHAIADSVNLPIMVYNVPARTGLDVLPATYAKLAKHENINCIKEANSNIGGLAKTISLAGDALNVYCGNDDEIVPFLSLGALGVVSVMANVAPRQVQDVCRLFFEGKIKESAELQISLIELCNALFCETNPTPVKYGVKLLGYGNGKVRLPLIEMEDKNRLETAMKKAGII